MFKCAARELAPAWEPNYQVSVDNHAVPSVWKTAHTEHPSITFCPTVLTSVIVKSIGTMTLEPERIAKKWRACSFIEGLQVLLKRAPSWIQGKRSDTYGAYSRKRAYTQVLEM